MTGQLTEISVCPSVFEPGPLYLPPSDEFIAAVEKSRTIYVPRRRLRTEGLGWLSWVGDVDCPPPTEFRNGLECVDWNERQFFAMTDSEIAEEVANTPGAVGVTGSHQVLKSGLRANVKTSSGGVVINDASFVLACLLEGADYLKELMNASLLGELPADYPRQPVVSEYKGIAQNCLDRYPGLFEVYECRRDAELKLRLPDSPYRAAVVIRQTGLTMGNLGLTNVCSYQNVRVTGVYNTDTPPLSKG